MYQEPKTICEIVEVDDPAHVDKIRAAGSSGIRIVTEEYGREADRILKPDTGDFVKWLRVTHPDLAVELPAARTLVLHSNDVWLPLVFLLQDVTLPIYLNFVSSYLYARFKTGLRGDKPRVHLSAEYIDEESGTAKRFHFEGDHEALRTAIKKFDVNKFMND